MNITDHTNSQKQLPSYLTVDEVCETMRMPKPTFYSKRCTQPGWGPPATKFGKTLVFELDGFLQWLNEQPVQNARGEWQAV